MDDSMHTHHTWPKEHYLAVRMHTAPIFVPAESECCRSETLRFWTQTPCSGSWPSSTPCSTRPIPGQASPTSVRILLRSLAV